VVQVVEFLPSKQLNPQLCKTKNFLKEKYST
jgi:hypothetical protein